MKKIDIKDAYPLSPMQEGILFHHLMDKKSTVYFEQIDFTIKIDLDRRILEESFNKLVEKYDIFRTVFVYEKVKKPRQVVLKKRRLNLIFRDISHFNERASADFIKNFLKKDLDKGFNLVADIPMRVSLIKIAPGYYRLIWSVHHIILDGWCVPIVFNELFLLYQSLAKGNPPELEPEYPYRNYIQWLEKQDKAVGLKFWEKYLEGYRKKALLPRTVSRYQGYRKEEYITSMDEKTSRDLTMVARVNQVTLSTIFQTIWGILLQKYNNTHDVVFGTVVSGRPPEIEGIEKMVGLFINTIPIRIRTEEGRQESFSQLLKRVHRQVIAVKPFEYLPLAEIQAQSLLKGDLIDNIVVFENYPIQIQHTAPPREFKSPIKKMEVFEQTNYDFNLISGPSEKLQLRMNFNSLAYEPVFVKRVGFHFMEVVSQVIKNGDAKLQEIKISNRLLTVDSNKFDEYQKDFGF